MTSYNLYLSVDGGGFKYMYTTLSNSRDEAKAEARLLASHVFGAFCDNYNGRRVEDVVIYIVLPTVEDDISDENLILGYIIDDSCSQTNCE